MVEKHLTMDVKKRVTLLQTKVPLCSVEEVMQYFTSAVVLGIGLFMLIFNITTFSRRIYFHNLIMDIKIDTTFLSLPAMILCIPCFCLTICLNGNRRRLFFTLIGLQAMAIIALIAGYSVGMKYQPKFSNDTLQMEYTIPKRYINNTLYKLIADYENNTEFKTSIDKIQSTLKCCGVYNKEDFSTIPASCCPENDCKHSNPYLAGCLRRMQEDIAWYRNVTASLTPVAILLYLFDGTMAAAMYASYYSKWKQSNVLNEETRRKYTE